MTTTEAREYMCPVCQVDPTSHSFRKLRGNLDADGLAVFYTCPSQATKYQDVDGIIAHYEGMLSDHQGKPWIWILDGQGFGLKHMTDTQVAFALVRFLNRYTTTLRKVIVINPTWHIRGLYNILWPFLSDSWRQLVEFKEESKQLDFHK